MTRWSPDTCGCVIEYDANVTWTATINACTKHSSVAGSSDHLTAVLAHNRAKNVVLNQLIALGADPRRTFVTYSSTDQMILNNVTAAQLAAVQATPGSSTVIAATLISAVV
jgi:hypothetical protein